MFSLASGPNLHRRELAQQTLLLRLGLIPLFALAALLTAEWRLGALACLGAYSLSSSLLLWGHSARVLGSVDVIYIGVADTSLFLAAGTWLTGGAQSPVLFLAFGMLAAFFALSSPRLFVIVAGATTLALLAGALLAAGRVGPEAWRAAQPAAHPWLYPALALGSMLMLAGVSWFHSSDYVRRAADHRRLSNLLAATPQQISPAPQAERVSALLDSLLASLDWHDEATVYSYDDTQQALRLLVSLGTQPWLKRFPVFQPAEGVIGEAFAAQETVVTGSLAELENKLGGLTPRNLEILLQTAKQGAPPSLCVAVPLLWEGKAAGALALTRQASGAGLSAEERSLIQSYAAPIAAILASAAARQRLERLESSVTQQTRFQPALEEKDPRAAIAELARRLPELVPFDCVRVVVSATGEANSNLGHTWSPGGLTVDDTIIERYFSHTLAAAERPGVGLDTPELWRSSPELSNLGAASVTGLAIGARYGQPGRLLGGLVLLHRQPNFYTREHWQALRLVEPYLSPLIGIAAASAELAKKMGKLDALQKIISLAHSGEDPDKTIAGVLQWAKTGIADSSPLKVFAILADREQGTVNALLEAPTEGEEAQRRTLRADGSRLGQVFAQWRDAETRWLNRDTFLPAEITELLPPAPDSKLAAFPLRAGEHIFGALFLLLPAGAELDEEREAAIRQFTALAAIALQNSQIYAAQARQARELKHEDEMRRSFISFITHEFRTPLTSLKTSFELIQESKDIRNLAEPYQRLLTNINRSVGALEQLINDLSEVANLSVGGVALNKAWTAPDTVVYPVLELTAPLSHLKSQSLSVEMAPDLPDFFVDGRRIEQALTNIVSNAIKYTPNDGRIAINVSQEEGSIKFVVSDTGGGIPEEYLEKVFEPFFRVPRVPVDRSPGSGLGLALAKSLVELHGGRIWVCNLPDQGCAFTFTIPQDAGE